MEIYNQIIRDVPNLIGRSEPKRYAYDPGRKGSDYYLGYFKPYDVSSLIDLGQKELEQYK